MLLRPTDRMTPREECMRSSANQKQRSKWPLRRLTSQTTRGRLAFPPSTPPGPPVSGERRPVAVGLLLGSFAESAEGMILYFLLYVPPPLQPAAAIAGCLLLPCMAHGTWGTLLTSSCKIKPNMSQASDKTTAAWRRRACADAGSCSCTLRASTRGQQPRHSSLEAGGRHRA